MNPVQQVVWYVESHIGDDLLLDDLANAAGVSRFHLVRAFGLATGQSPMQYLRARRLSEAAQRLAAGAKDILELALDARYGSHEAFTRAFRDHFGLTPEALRALGRVDTLRLTPPIRLDESPLEHQDEPRWVAREAFLLAGLRESWNYHSSAGVPSQWQRFSQEVAPALRRHALDTTTYGVLNNSDDAGNLDYLCGMQVSDNTGLPSSWSRLRVPALCYAVFAHAGHVSAIRRSWYSIWNRWLPASGCEPVGGLEFERYGPGFDPHSGFGDIEIWLPVADRVAAADTNMISP